MHSNRDRFDLAIRKRPFLWMALPIIIGILTAEYLDRATQFRFGAVLVTALLGFLPVSTFRKLITLGLLFLSYSNTHWHSGIHSSQDLRLVIGNQPRFGTVEGIIRQAPISRARETGSQTRFQSQFVLQAKRIQFLSDWHEAIGLIFVRVDEALLPDLYPGTTVSVTGTLHHPSTPIVRGGYNARRQLRFKGIHYELHLRAWNPGLTVVQRPPKAPFPNRFQSWARQTLARGQPEDQATKLIWAMALGWRTWLTGEIREPFMLTGTLHVFAISGLHISLITGLLVVILRCVGIRRRFAGYLVIPCLWLYVAATGYPASAIRAATISSVILVGWILKRPPEALNSLGIAVTLLLIFDPLQLFQPGFQLSFTVVLLLILLYPKLNSYSQYFFKDEALRPTLSRHRIWRFAVRASLKLHAALAVSLSAWLGSLGLIATYFNLATPISILANLILIPLAGLTMASSLMALLSAALLPPITTLANSSAWFWMSAMIEFCDHASTLPGAYFKVPSPSPAQCLLYYLTLCAWGLSKSRSTSIGILFFFIVIEIASLSFRYLKMRETTRLTLLPIPEGDAIFIDAPGRKSDWMIDGGPNWSASRALVPFLKNHSHNANFTNHILTHGDKKHLEALGPLFAEPTPRRIITSSMKFRSVFYRELIQKSRDQGHTIGQRTSPNRLGPWQILHPHPSTRPSPADDAAMVLLGHLHGITILLLSDLDRDIQHELLDRYPTLEVDIVVLNLPRPITKPNHFVLRQLSPQALVITGSDTERGDRWVRTIEMAFPSQTTQFFFTGTDGAIEITVSPNQAQISTHSGKIVPIQSD